MHAHDGGTTAARRLAAWTGAIALLLGYAWWAVSRPPFSAAATAAVLLAGAAGAFTGALSRGRTEPRVVAPRGGAWVVLGAAAGLWQLAAYLQQPRHEHPTLSSLANALLDSQPARAAAFVVWVLGTVRLARR